ncbi:MAG: polysaccharide biosynthesis tyrosine autokinase [Sedimentisphaerales bacterium]|nr:polysaccharide biosynthesis tyrosine autokinase [Sedimentisphaerales bacterium]
MTPKEVLGVLRRHMVLIILLTIIGLAAGGGACWLLRHRLPKYTAVAFIEVLPPVQTDPMLITTPQVQQNISYGHRLSVADIITRQGTLQQLLARRAISDTKWYRSKDSLQKRLASLKKHLVVRAHRDAAYIQVAMTCGDGQEAADIANEMVTMFVSSYGATKKDEVAQKLKELGDRHDKVSDELTQAETALDEVRNVWDFTDLEQPVGSYYKHTISLKLDQLELQKSDLELAIRQLEADLKILEGLSEGPLNIQITHAIENDQIMLSLKQALVFADARLVSLLVKFGENHRTVREIQEYRDEIETRREIRAEEIGDQLRKSNLASAKDRLTVYRERSDELERLRQEAETKKKELDTARTQYRQREQIRDERREMLNEIKGSLEKLRIIHSDPETPKVREGGIALRPLEQVVSRQWWVWFPGGTVMGFLFSLAIAFLVELANDLVRTPRDVNKYLSVPLLGVIPDASEDRDVRGIDLSRVVSLAPYSILSESYRQCRANLKLSGTGASLKTLLVTSGSAGDGKTCVAVNLATAFVAEDRKVLLIDANFRQPTSEKLFPRGAADSLDDGGTGVGFGLSSLLVGQCGAQEAIRSSGIDGLDIIDAGLLPPNPAELLGSVRMADLLAEQRNNYDYIVIDSPPVLLISDSRVLAKHVDATVVVLNAAATRRGAALRTIRELKDLDANVVGCILLGAPSLKGGYFQEQYKSYRRYQQNVQAAM